MPEPQLRGVHVAGVTDGLTQMLKYRVKRSTAAVVSGGTTPATEERAAERFAQEVVSEPSSVSVEPPLPASPPATPPCVSRLPPAVAQMLSSPSHPLEPEHRARFEPMLQHSLVDVRLHVGPEADAAARSADAHALAVGRHVGFATGWYAPGTADGDRALAHELAHVVQQTSHGPARIQYLLPEWVARAVQLVRYAKLFEVIAHEEGQLGPFYTPQVLPVLYLMRKLVLALDAGDAAGVKDAIARLTAEPLSLPANEALQVLLGDVMIRLIGDTLNLGLDLEARQLSRAFTAGGDWKGVGRTSQEERQHWVFSELADRALLEVNLSGPEATEASIERLLRVFRSIEQELSAPYRGFDNDWELLLQQLAQAALQAFQTLMEAAITELESQAGTTTELKRARDVIGRMRDTILPHYPEAPVLSIEVTKSDFGAKPNPRHLDYFRQDRKAPSVGISAYSRTEAQFEEKKLSVRRVLDIRVEQLDALEMIFGHEQDDRGQVTARSQENADAIAAIGGFRLDDNESWRRFTLEKFRLAKARPGDDDAKALSATIDVLGTYLQTFTIHTPYNIDDFGEEYLSKTFPRALTGQLIHDCGVYALRVAYALSLVRKELDLDFRAIVLPVHVGLIISFKNRNHPVWIAHNNDIRKYDEDDLTDLYERWVASKGPLAMRFEREDFLAHIAAGEFVQGVDLPFRTETVPDVPDVAEIKKRHLALWGFYLKKLVQPDVVRPAGGLPQPELLYLDVLESQRMIHDTYSVPLWKRGYDWWNAHQIMLEDALKNYQPRSTTGPLAVAPPIAASNLMFRYEIRPYWEELWKMSQEWRRAVVEQEKKRREVAEFIRTNPRAVDPSARLTGWGKFVLPREEERVVWDYIGDPGSEADRLEADSGKAFETVEAQGNSRLLKGEILPPWGSPYSLLRPND
jgi:hypothetical protein